MNIMIAGPGRSGSTFLAELLHSHPDVFSTNELATYQQQTAKAHKMLSDPNNGSYSSINKHKTLDKANFIQEVNPGLTPQQLINLFKKHTKEQFKHYADKDHSYCFRMNDFIANGNVDKVIICLRGPKDFVSSHFKYNVMPPEDLPSSWGGKLPTWTRASWQEVVDSGNWLQYMSPLDAGLASTNKEYLVVRFSDLCENPDQVNKALSDYLGVDLTESFKKVKIKHNCQGQWKKYCPDIQLPQSWIDMANKYKLKD